ncbi:Ger(x)C family spore germination C-terminal domain-containing protein [Brevibacillus sp. DP1.3A]|uniref:Ger(x)C family spore germination C-terminal domain-containing protein n=1 Tax=Brevibacillus sp. DP1.3A TaxID=2738867 RepID=UPI00156A812B|nr:Ger(x)C family spore germination C-terminal domain-containing protein [Brevibacillus sp. DP1.3A]UED77777.1 Ger(x)C family spore germination C-terminal domain-containing protein [Brevibacillus sp. DP1.3A]
MEKAIAVVMKQNMEGVIAKLQKKQVDPIGLGKYARAYAYAEWKKVEDDWGRVFSKAKVTIHPEVKIIRVGVLKK